MTADQDPEGPTGFHALAATVPQPRSDGFAVLDLLARPGERVALLAEPGLDIKPVLAACAGRRPVTSGRVTLDGEPVGTAAARGSVGYITADRHLIGTLTAAENLHVVLLASGVASAELSGRVEDQFAELGLSASTWHNLVEELSGGQQQRVALARALVLRPSLLVLEDPTSELDPDSASLVHQVLEREAAAGVIVVLTTTDRELLAACHRQTEVRLTDHA